jgi:hypothetical protein
MTFIHHHPLPVSLAIGAGLLALWLAGGLAAALVGGALADLALTAVERRRARNAAPDTRQRIL